MSDDLPIDARRTIPGELLSFRAVRASGPGGQNVNKVATKVVLSFDLDAWEGASAEAKARLRALAKAHLDAEGKIAIASDATRSQARNLEDARRKLAALVRRAFVVPKRRRPTKPTASSKRRRVDAKRRQSEKKQGRGRVSGDD